MLQGADSTETIPLTPEANGQFSGLAKAATAGTRYRFRVDGEERLYPDPASRFQPEGPHGPSQVVDPASFAWTDGAWRGVALPGQVIYELHVGTFTPEGTWAAAVRELPELAAAGITVVELMPVAEFPGRFGWGYDGVNLFAPTRLYGDPDDFRRFVDRAHAVGIAVILDVVYNHLGPDGNYLRAFSEAYFTDKYATEWGEPINFDGPDSGPVREFFLANAGYWIDEFHCDGLRLDATQSIHDDSPTHLISELGLRVRRAAGGRATLVVVENEPQRTDLVRPIARGGHGLDALWNDDFHHSAMVALTGRNEAYYSDHRGTSQEFISAAKYGHLFQGQRYAWQQQRRGTPTFGLPPATFVTFIQNHDQIANSSRGLRVHQLTSPTLYRAMTALLLLSPGTPMLFQGQEFAASAPFLYFADHEPDLAKLVREGRRTSIAQFPSVARPEMQALLDAPDAPATFDRCKLDLSERERHAEAYALHKDLLKLRREEPAFRAQRPGGLDGAVLSSEAFVLRFFGQDIFGRNMRDVTANDDTEEGFGLDDRLLVVNFGTDLDLVPAPEPLLAPPPGHHWAVRWSSEDPRYGGSGTPPPEDDAGGWHLMGRSATVLAPEPVGAPPAQSRRIP